MRVLFVGSTQLGAACIEAIKDVDSIEICGIITAPEQFQISYAPNGIRNVLHAGFSRIAEQIGCPILILEGKMSSGTLRRDVELLSPDCIFVVGWHHMIPKSWLRKWPTFGIHASLLPDYAGGAPLVWAMIEGQKWVGVTLFQFDDGIDSGPIVSQQRIRIRRSDDIASVLKKVERASVVLSIQEVPQLLSPESTRRKQDLSNRKIYPQRRPEDGLITDLMTVKQIRNFVRAQTRPYPGAFVEIDGERLTIWAVGRSSFSLKSRHTVFQRRNRIFLGRGRRCIRLRFTSNMESAKLDETP